MFVRTKLKENTSKGSELPSHMRTFEQQRVNSVSSSVAGVINIPSIAGNLAIQRQLSSSQLQAKLVSNQQGDSHEREADRVADQVQSGNVQSQCGGCVESAPCSKCQAGKKQTSVPAKTSDDLRRPSGGPSHSALIPSVGGRPLDYSVRSELGPALGIRLDDVRIHSGPDASRYANTLAARAYTVGRDVVFGDVAPPIDSSAGRRLLVHELTHVAQQAASGSQVQRSELDTPMSPAAAAALKDFELDGQIAALQAALVDAPPGTGEPWIQNLRTLENQRSYRDALLEPLTPWVPVTPLAPVTLPAPLAPASCASCHPSTVPSRPSSFDFPGFGLSEGSRGFGIGPIPTPRPERRNIAMEQGIEVEKWDERLEYEYRRRGDEPRARMIQACRENGAVVCAWLMTVAEAWRLYELAKAEASRLRDERMSAEARGSLLNFLDAPQIGRPPKPTATGLFTPYWLGPLPAPVPVPIPSPTPSPAPGPGIAPGAEGLLVSILAMYLLSAISDLIGFRDFQIKLHELGYTVLEDPLGLCIQGCHLPQTEPLPWPEPLPGPEPSPKPKPDKRRRKRPVPTLWLPAGKYRHSSLYQSIIRARRLGADPAYERPDTSQAEEWRRRMDPERGGNMVGSMFALGVRLVADAMNCDPERDRDCRERVKRRVLLPDWMRAGSPHLFDTDHVVELQVGALLPFAYLDSMANYELLDFSVNRSIGPQLYAAIEYERNRLAALDPDTPWHDIVLVFERLVEMGQHYAEFWSSSEVELGEHIEVFRQGY